MKRFALAVIFIFTFLCSSAYAVPFTNPGFEDGLTGWTDTGDAAAIGSFGETNAISAPFGSLMGCISTSDNGFCGENPAIDPPDDGIDGPTTSTLEQLDFEALLEPVTMVVNFLTFEHLATDPEDDVFMAITTGGDVLLEIDVLNDVGDLNALFFDGPSFGSNTMKQTGWIPFTIPAGKTDLTLKIEDAVDTEFISVALIDVVPEPATLLLFGSGLAGIALWRRRRKA